MFLINIHTSRIYSHAESGVFVGLLQRLRMNFLLNFNKENRVYSTINEFVADMTGFDNLSYGNFRMAFRFYFSFCLTLLIVFGCHLIGIKVSRFWSNQRRRRMIRLRRGRNRSGVFGFSGFSILRGLYRWTSALCDYRLKNFFIGKKNHSDRKNSGPSLIT